MSEIKGAPLKVWLIVLSISSFIIIGDQLFKNGLLYVTSSKSEMTLLTNLDNKNSQIDKGVQQIKNTDSIRILALGSSRFGSGVGYTSYINKSLSECLGGTVVLFALSWAANATLETFFDDPKVYGLIKDYNPTYILIEKNLLLTQRSRSIRANVHRDLERIIEKGPSDRNYRTLKPEDNQWNPKHDSGNMKKFVRYYKRQEIRDFPWKASMETYTSGLVKGSRIIGIEMPFPMKIDSVRNQYFEHQELVLMQRIHEKFGIDFILSNHKFPFRLYRDKNHLNQDGQEIYTDWMIEELCDYISKSQ